MLIDPKMIKYGRIINQYRYEMQKRPGDSLWPRDGNLGDCMQSLGVENVYKKAGVDIDNLQLVKWLGRIVRVYLVQPSTFPTPRWLAGRRAKCGGWKLPWRAAS